MKRFIIGKAGIISNIVAADDISQVSEPGSDIFEDVAGNTQVGAAYDVRDVAYDRLDVATFKILFQVINDVRVLKGQAVLTAAQFKIYVKNQMA